MTATTTQATPAGQINRWALRSRVVNGWQVKSSTGAAGPFHHRDLSDITDPSIWIHRVERPAFVLGSSQLDDIVDREEAGRLGIEVCARRSGGGAVLVEPSSSCWIDALVPPTSSLWHHDVNLAFGWIGTAWRRALVSLGVPDLDVHSGGLEDRDMGRVVCFAGVGPGEVVQRNGSKNRKLVGLSQRRTRTVARFQGLLITRWNAELLDRLVRPGAWPDHRRARDILAGADDESMIDLDAVPSAVLAMLPDPFRHP